MTTLRSTDNTAKYSNEQQPPIRLVQECVFVKDVQYFHRARFLMKF